MTQGLDRLWAGWRSEYVESAGVDDDAAGCVLCRILTSDLPDEETYVVWRGDHSAVVLNAYPYGSGHVMALPLRHVAMLDDLEDAESAELWRTATTAVAAIRRAYSPGGVNLGANLGQASGAGVPGHLHLHALPRWSGDTNFMTTVAEVRVLPEALPVTWRKLREAWPSP